MKQRLYVFNNTQLKRKQNTLFFEQILEDNADDNYEFNKSNSEEYLIDNSITPATSCGKYMPIENVDSIFAVGTINFNSQFLYFLNKYRIPLHVCNYKGTYAGSFIPANRILSGNSLVNQTEHYKDSAKRLYIAKQFIEAASHNTLCNLKYHERRNSNVSEYIDFIKEMKSEIVNINSVNELLGVEGTIKKAYFEAWKEIFNYPVNFYKRVKNPPNNLINSLISYGNMIVYGICINEIHQTKLYPEVSFLHAPSEGRLSLCFDIAEMFKPLITDRIIFKVINKNMITEKSAFVRNGFCKLSNEAKKIFTQEFELKLNTKLRIGDNDKRVTYKRLIREECFKLHKHINNEIIYTAYKTKW